MSDQTKPHAACPQVLHTPELLENILVHLDRKTLLLSQRVNTTFKNVIAGSKPLQRRLFFLPDSKPQTSSWSSTLKSRSWVFNDLLRCGWTGGPSFGRWKLGNAILTHDCEAADKGLHVRFEAVHARKTHPDASPSWRRMLLVQNLPSFEVEPTANLECLPLSSRYFSECIVLDGALTLGEVVDKMDEEWVNELEMRGRIIEFFSK